MKFAKTMMVRAPSKRYAVYYGRGAARQCAEISAKLGSGGRVFLLSSRNVAKRIGRNTVRRMGGTNRRIILFDDRETAKNLTTVEKICRALVTAGADRRSTIVAVGGGVVGDVAGFAAASFLRGVRLIHVPTTLVAQVDSAIGGKTGVNLPEGKNLVGAFYQPDAVLVDPSLMRTLPDREYRSGLFEVMKYGIIGDAELFRYCEGHLTKLLRREPRALDYIIPRCIAAKARITAADELESGLRETLNFGHTFGHALESATGYSKFRHGEAVGWGMIAATLLGVVLTKLPPMDAARIVRLVRSVGALPDLPKLSGQRLLAAMRSDKKSRGGRLRFVLPLKIGHVRTGVEVPDEIISLAWNELSRVEGGRR